MPRAKKQHLKKRADGRFACRYHDQWFYGQTEDEALEQREIYKRLERSAASRVPTVSEYAAGYLRRISADLRPCTVALHKNVMNKLTAACGDLPVDAVLPSMIKDVYTDAFAGLSGSYIAHARSMYKGMFAAAMDDRLCTSNPAVAESAQPHKGTAGSHRAITEQEREWIETLCTDHPLYPGIMVMLYAGLRPQEAKALDIDRDIDLKKKQIRVCRSIHHTGKNLVEYEIDDKLKTDKALRIVPLFPPVEEALRGRHGRLIPCGSEYEWSRLWNSYVRAVERAVNGMTRNMATLNRLHWTSFDVRPYDLRHSFVTWCRDHDVELHTLITWTGHTDVTMILKIYDEVGPKRSQREIEKLLSSAFRSQNGSQPKNKNTGNA